MGQVGFGELAFWLVALRRPTPGELRVFEAVLVALADHGFTPSAIAARLTLTGAPESVQGAMAAGLLGGGSRFLGVTEDAGRFLAVGAGRARGAGGELPTTDEGWDDLARDAVRAQRAAGRLRPRPRAPRPQGRRPAHPGAAPDRRGGGPARPAPAAVRGGRARAPGAARPDAAAQRRGRRAAPRCATSASRSTSCAGSRCWPARPGCSATSPRRCAARSASTIYDEVDRSTDYGPPDRRPARQQVG